MNESIFIENREDYSGQSGYVLRCDNRFTLLPGDGVYELRFGEDAVSEFADLVDLETGVIIDRGRLLLGTWSFGQGEREDVCPFTAVAKDIWNTR